MKYILSLFGALLLAFGIAQADDLRQHIDIPAQALSSALDNLAKQTKLQMLFDRQALVGKQSSGLSGDYTGVDAARKLLAGSGLIVEKTGDNAVSIRQAAPGDPQSATTLKPVTVTGKANRDVTDPYNQDYVLPNATAGTKTDTPIMETPLNVQVISKQVLKDQQVITVADALQNVSGVSTATYSYNSLGGGTTQGIFLRGFPSQTYFRDGFRLQQGASSRNMSNIEAVEVLKGPAAILYGMVEPGGMVNVITKQPLATPYYALSQQFGSFANYRTTVDATGPLTKDDTLLYRLNMSYQDTGSVQQFGGKQDVFIAPVLKWNISPKTQATVEFEYNHQNIGLATGFVPIVNGQLFRVPQSVNYGENSPGTVESFYGGFNWSHAFNDDWTVKHRVSVNQSSADASSLMVPQSATDTTISRAAYGSVNNNNTYSTNIDLTGHFNTFGLRHTLLTGGDYYRIDFASPAFIQYDENFNRVTSDINIYNPVHTGNFTQPIPWFSTTKQQTDQYGFYIQDQIKLPFDVHVMGGIRYQNFHQGTGNQYGPLLASLGVPDSFSAVSQSAVTPRVGILWQPQKWLSLYANYVESFGPNSGLIYPGTPVPPTSASQYEGGIKTEFYNGRLRANLAYFDLTKTNIATADPAHPNSIYVLAAGAVQSRGYEFDMTGEILPGWNAIATYSYTDAQISKSFDTSSVANSNAGNFGAVGTRYWGVPRNTASLWNTYELQQGDLKGLKFGGGVTVRDGQTACCDAPAFTIPGYATVNLMTAYSRKVGKSKVTVQLNVNNLLDKYYYTGLNTAYSAGGSSGGGPNSAYVDFGAPRTFMGSIGIQY